MPTYVEMKGIVKDFPGVRALNGVDLEVFGGEIHAIVGENGAGKSTLMKILAGIYPDYAGSIRVNGKEVRIYDPMVAQDLGIAMIFQELHLVPRMTVAQNIYLGREPLTRWGLVDGGKQEEGARAILGSLKVSLDPKKQVIHLSPAERQIVEIAKAIASEPNILIMDEPTSSLPSEETAVLFQILRELRGRGVAIVFISHRIAEVLEIADRITVLRDGSLIASAPIVEWTEDKIVKAMVGREIPTLFPRKTGRVGEVILSVRDLSADDGFHNVSFDLHKGEILGFYGLIGSGRTEVAEALFGLNPARKGVITIHGKSTNIQSVTDAIKSRLFLVPEDRRGKGLVPRLSVKLNLTLASLQNYSGRIFIDEKLQKKDATDMISRLRIRATSENAPVEFLSGGNQQKVVVGKCLLTHPDVIIMDEPTRGIDIGSKAEIYRWIVSLADEGKGIILISSELPEILGLSDRILVFCEGSVSCELSRNEATEEAIMRFATGISMASNPQNGLTANF